MIDWMEYLKQAVSEQASDVFFVAGGPVWEKLEGRIRTLGQQRLLPDVTPLAQGLQEAYAWYREHRDLIRRKPLIAYIDEHLGKE